MQFAARVSGFLLLAAAGCSDPWESMEITVVTPDAEGDTADVSYLVEWTVSNTESWYDARIDLFADTDTDPSVGQVMIAESLSLESTAYSWECGLFPEGSYYIRALLYQEAWENSDYSSGTVTIMHD
jgi:hypothetical protein